MQQFVEIRGDFYSLGSVLSVRRTKKPGIGRDGVSRSWIVTVTPESIGATLPRYCHLWCNEEEVLGVLDAVGKNMAQVKETAP